MKLSPQDVTKRYHVEEAEEWRKWCRRIPSLQFPDHWHVQVIPPFSGAIARFQVALEPFEGEEMPDGKISVYLDVHERLGYGGGPYWEIYPYPYDNNFTDGVDYDTFRCSMDDTETLIGAIVVALGEGAPPSDNSTDNYEWEGGDDE